MHYVLDENKNLVEAFSKEEVLAVLQQAIDNGSLANIVSDAGFVSKVKCCVGGDTFKLAFITQAKYNELAANGELIENCYYFITDDSTCEDINKALEDMQTELETSLEAFKKMFSLTADARQVIPAVEKTVSQNTLLLWRNEVGSKKVYLDGTNETQAPYGFTYKTHKTREDVIGLSGKLLLFDGTNAGATASEVYFSTLWNNNGGVTEQVAQVSVWYAYNKYISFEIGIQADNGLYIDNVQHYVNGTSTFIHLIGLNSLNIFYK